MERVLKAIANGDMIAYVHDKHAIGIVVLEDSDMYELGLAALSNVELVEVYISDDQVLCDLICNCVSEEDEQMIGSGITNHYLTQNIR
jgi:hypothetical protein